MKVQDQYFRLVRGKTTILSRELSTQLAIENRVKLEKCVICVMVGPKFVRYIGAEPASQTRIRAVAARCDDVIRVVSPGKSIHRTVMCLRRSPDASAPAARADAPSRGGSTGSRWCSTVEDTETILLIQERHEPARSAYIPDPTAPSTPPLASTCLVGGDQATERLAPAEATDLPRRHKSLHRR